jgi:Zn-dependent peptidase ImmA (M78 family)
VPSLHSNRGAKRAREARAALGLDSAAPIDDLVPVVEDLGRVHVVLLALPDGVAGAYAAREDCPMIFVNGRQAIARQRFTLAHEFGHHRLRHATVVDRVTTIGGFQHDPVEVEANAFAAEFLMSKPAIRDWGRRETLGAVTLEDVVRLAYAYGVSAQAARYALETAGVLTEERRCAALDREIAEDLHADIGPRLGLVPMHDEIAEAANHLPRIPKALAGSALGDLLTGELDVAGLAERLDRPTNEVEAMLDAFGLSQLLPLET